MKASNARFTSALAAVAVVIMLGASGCGSSTTDAGSTDTTVVESPSTTVGTSVEPTTPAGPVDLVVISTPYGDALGTDDGLVLYAWDEEADGTLVCVDAECVEKWPPVLAAEIGEAGDLDPTRISLVDRPDGTTQVAVDGRALYHMAIDEPGEANCQGGDGWWILNPDGTTNTNLVPRDAVTPAS